MLHLHSVGFHVSWTPKKAGKPGNEAKILSNDVSRKHVRGLKLITKMAYNAWAIPFILHTPPTDDMVPGGDPN